MERLSSICLCLLIFPDLSVCLQCSPVPTAPVMLHSCIFPIVYLAFGFPFHRLGLRDATRIIFIEHVNDHASALLRDFSGSLMHTGSNPSLSLSTAKVCPQFGPSQNSHPCLLLLSLFYSFFFPANRGNLFLNRFFFCSSLEELIYPYFRGS